MSLLRIKRPRPPAPTIVNLDENGNLLQVEEHLRIVQLSYGNRAVVYLEIQWAKLEKASLERQTYTMVGSGDWTSRRHRLLTWTLPGPVSSMEAEMKIKAYVINATVPVTSVSLPEESSSTF